MNVVRRFLIGLFLVSLYGMAAGAEVCASIGPYTLSFDRRYLAFSPSVKGVDYWAGHDPARTKRVECADQVDEITIHFNWPQMSPAADQLFSTRSVIAITTASIRPQDSAPPDMSVVQNFNTLSSSKAQKESVKYNAGLKLYGYRGNHGAVDGLYAYYWANNAESRPWFFMMCTPLPNGELFKCEGKYYLERVQSLIVLSFPANRISDWEKIVEDTNTLIVSALKH